MITYIFSQQFLPAAAINKNVWDWSNKLVPSLNPLDRDVNFPANRDKLGQFTRVDHSSTVVLRISIGIGTSFCHFPIMHLYKWYPSKSRKTEFISNTNTLSGYRKLINCPFICYVSFYVPKTLRKKNLWTIKERFFIFITLAYGNFDVVLICFYDIFWTLLPIIMVQHPFGSFMMVILNKR